MGRFRQVLVFDRFLARLFEHFGDRAIAKGGVVLELRLSRARTTRDVDVRRPSLADTSRTPRCGARLPGPRTLGRARIVGPRHVELVTPGARPPSTCSGPPMPDRY